MGGERSLPRQQQRMSSLQPLSTTLVSPFLAELLSSQAELHHRQSSMQLCATNTAQQAHAPVQYQTAAQLSSRAVRTSSSLLPMKVVQPPRDSVGSANTRPSQAERAERAKPSRRNYYARGTNAERTKRVAPAHACSRPATLYFLLMQHQR